MDIRIVDGRLVGDAEVKVNKSGVKYLSFTIANNGFSKGEKTTTYFKVASYNPLAIQKQETNNFYCKGKLVVVTGQPNENMTARDNKMYLNRNILAYSIELGNSGGEKKTDEQASTSTVYHDVAPAAPTCEAPRAPQPQAPVPGYTAVTPRTEAPVMPAAPVVPPVAPPVAPQPAPAPAPVAVNAIPQIGQDDDLPF